jgi:hypothetical protein
MLKNATAGFGWARAEDMKKMVSAAITIQKRMRGVEARALTAIHKMSKAAETALLKHLNPNLSPAENACNLLLDIISVRSVTCPVCCQKVISLQCSERYCHRETSPL